MLRNKQYWEELKGRPDHLKVNGAYQEAYVDFMYNEQNIKNCMECPYGGNCGQRRCWVIAHLNHTKRSV